VGKETIQAKKGKEGWGETKKGDDKSGRDYGSSTDGIEGSPERD